MHLNRAVWVVALLGGLTAVSSILASAAGAHAILLAVASMVFTCAVVPLAVKLQDRKADKREQLRPQAKQEPTADTPKLDADCADLRRRAVAAVEIILGSAAYGEGLLEPPVNDKLLRENVRAVSVAGQKITEFRAKHRWIIAMSSPKSKPPLPPSDRRSANSFPAQADFSGLMDAFFGQPSTNRRAQSDPTDSGIQAGPMTAGVIEPQRQYIAMAMQSMTSRVEKLEHYATTVNAVDATYRDWGAAQQAERLNEPIRDLLADTAKDELAVAELKMLSERTAAAELAFRQSIQIANRAAETLALPNAKES